MCYQFCEERLRVVKKKKKKIEQRGFVVIKCPLTLDLSNVRKGMRDNRRSADLITRIKQALMGLLVTGMFN